MRQRKTATGSSNAPSIFSELLYGVDRGIRVAEFVGAEQPKLVR
jgi:hypothetical protein